MWASIIYGGTHIDEDFRDRSVVDQWFQGKFNQRMAAKDMEVTTKYRYDPKFNTGGTFGVNYAAMDGDILAFNYRTIYWSQEARRDLHERFILNHYLKQFNQETIQTKQQRNCGEPCSAVCKKMHGRFKEDYEPYQTMGPLCGIFDQRAAEQLNHHADRLGFDAISVGGTLAWLLDCLDDGLHALRPGFPAAPGVGTRECPAHAEGTDAGQPWDLPVSPGLGGNADSRYYRKHLWGISCVMRIFKEQP